MKRVVAPDHGLKEVDGTSGVRYRRQPDGTFRTTDRDAKLLVEYGGFIQPDMGVATSRSQGFRCKACGFGSWFKRCSKCGGECEREA